MSSAPGPAVDRLRRGHPLPALAAAALAIAMSLGSPARAQTPAGTRIDNTAGAAYQVGGTPGFTSGSNTLTLVTAELRTPSALELMQHAPGAAGAQLVAVGATECSAGGAVGGPFSPLPSPVELDGAPIPVPGALDLLPAPLFALGAPVFIRLDDRDQNRSSGAVETVAVRLTTPSGDSERVRLFETAADSGVFAGHVQTSPGPLAAGDCLLQGTSGDVVSGFYADPADASDTATAAAGLSPESVVFDAFTGQPLDGATVTLVDDASGLPAAPLGDDGVSAFPATLTSGGAAVDGSGRSYAFGPGAYRFPLVPPGTYRLVITPPAGYLHPSAVATPQLQTLPGAPFAIGAGSRGQPFAVAAPAPLDFDVPLDPISSELFLTKTTSAAAVGPGEFAQYDLRVRNPGASAAPAGVALTDVLPLGFRYQAGSLTIDGAPAPDPSVAPDGRTLGFTLGPVPLPAFARVRYVVQVTAGAPLGIATNRAVAQVAGGLESHVATADVLVREDLFTQKSFLLGSVIAGSCDAPAESDELAGLPGARVYLQNGTYAVTDERGLFHFEGVEPGTHVVQLDLESLPARYQAVLCRDSTRRAGRAFSRFVELRPGALWRTDFRVALREPDAGYVSQTLESVREGERISHRVDLRGDGVAVRRLRAVLVLDQGTRYVPGTARVDGAPAPDPVESEGTLMFALSDPRGRWTRSLGLETRVVGYTGESHPAKTLAYALFETPARRNGRTPVAETLLDGGPRASSGVQLVETTGARAGETWSEPGAAEPEPASAPDYDEAWLARASPELEWLEPRDGASPPIPSVKIAVVHPEGESLELHLNGEPVSPLNFEGSLRSPGGAALSRWRGVDLAEGPNRFTVIARGSDGAERGRLERSIHYSGPPEAAELVPEATRALADGRAPPVIAVRLRDRWGVPVRRGAVGAFEVEPPYRARAEREALQKRQLAGLDPERPTYRVGGGGIAELELEPTTATGKVRIRIQLAGGREERITAWLDPEDRDWVVVGLAAGTLGYQRLSGNMEAFEALGVEEDGSFEERVSLFAKGRVKGEWLLTLAYDSEGVNDDAGERLRQTVDPDQYYTLYGSASEQGYEAPTSSKLYLKLERRQLYALFGDYDTGLEVTELSRYSRTFTGFKSEYDGDRVAFSAFATETRHGFVRDELRGDGTSGLYRLTRTDMVRNSEKVTIETRDRFRTERVLRSERLAPHLDYDVDYEAGTLFFKQPVPSKDERLNPVFIVIEYESDDRKDDSPIAGGRGAVRLLDARLEIGASAIHEGTTGRDGELVGVDLRYDLADSTRLRAEVARTHTRDTGTAERATAYLAELASRTERLDARAYVRELESDFGLGHQSGTERGSRKLGADARYALTDRVRLEGQAYRHTHLAEGADRDVVEARADYGADPVNLFGGFRFARDSSDSGPDLDSRQLIGGGSYAAFDRALLLRLNTEISLDGDGENPDFPTRAILGADWSIAPTVTVFGEQEFAFGERQDSRGTRLGVRATPWTGASASTSLEQSLTENGARTFANLGLKQAWYLNDRWSVDASVDHVHTLRDPGDAPFNPAVPPTSGTLDDDFTALSFGSTLRRDRWSWTARIETRAGELEDKWGVFMGLHRELREGLGYSLRLELLDVDTGDAASSRRGDLELGLAYRPVPGRWVVLDRLNLGWDRRRGAFDVEDRKIVNNLSVSYRPGSGLQVSLHYGAKYVRDTIDSRDYDGFIDVWGLELRRDLGERWDLGVAARLRHSWKAELYESSYGVELGRRLRTNLWVSAGYNLAGFRDDDFSGANRTQRGPYLRFRYKFDQVTIRDLLDRGE